MKLFVPILLALALGSLTGGCANPPIVEIGGTDTYVLTKEDHAGIFGSMAKLKADVISEANRIADSKGKVVLPIAFREKPVGNSPGDWASIEYQFRLVDKDSPELANSSLNANRQTTQVRPDISVQTSQTVSADIAVSNGSRQQSPAPPTQPQPRDDDLYAELLKLDDLRKKGIITEAEFQAQKTKLLQQH